MAREFELQALEYIKTCASPEDRTYILALSVALDNAHGRVETLVRSAQELGVAIEKIVKDARR